MEIGPKRYGKAWRLHLTGGHELVIAHQVHSRAVRRSQGGVPSEMHRDAAGGAQNVVPRAGGEKEKGLRRSLKGVGLMLKASLDRYYILLLNARYCIHTYTVYKMIYL